MRILLAGDGQTTRFLTRSLKQKGHEVTIVSRNYETARTLATSYNVIAIHGDASKEYVLKDAQTEQMDLVITLTRKDADNLVICQLAKNLFKVENLMSSINDPENIELFKKVGIQKLVSGAQTISNIIEQEAISSNLSGFLPMKNGSLVIFEFVVAKNSRVMNKRLMDIEFPKESILACIVRKEETIIPNGESILQEGDIAIVVSKKIFLEKVKKQFIER